MDYLRAEKSLAHYIKCAWSILEPDSRLLWNWHHDYICEHLMAAEKGEITRLIINIAPRTTKSIMTTIGFPTWVWARTPAKRFLFGSYAADLATKQSMFRRNIIESEWYQRGYGERFQLSSDSNTKSEFRNDLTGQMKSGGIGSPPTGEGGDYIIIDDPHNPQQAESEADRESALKTFDLGWSNRLNDKKTGRIIIIMQRLHENDLTGHLLAKNLGYTHLKIPTVAEERERLVFPVTKREVIREQGDYLHPERDGPKEIEQAKRDMGPYGYSGQHQQDPVPASGAIFREDMFDFVDLPEKMDYRFVTADTAYKEKQENDFTVFSAWGVKKNSEREDEIYLLDVWRKQIQAAEVEVPVAAFIKRFSGYGFRGAYIEPKGHGIYLNQKLPKVGVMIPSETDRKKFFEDRKHDKVMRANNAVPHLANRKIHINKNIHDKEYLVKECLKFPKGRWDDFVDTTIDAIKFTFDRSVSILDAYRK